MNPTYDFRDRVALVTGGDSGIGLATAQAFAEAGAAVVLAARNEERLEAAADGLVAAGHQAIPLLVRVQPRARAAVLGVGCSRGHLSGPGEPPPCRPKTAADLGF